MLHTVHYITAQGEDVSRAIETSRDSLDGTFAANGTAHGLGYVTGKESRQAAITHLLTAAGCRLQAIQTEGEQWLELLQREQELEQAHNKTLELYSELGQLRQQLEGKQQATASAAAEIEQGIRELQQERDNYKTLAESTARQLDIEQQRSAALARESEPAEQLLRAITKALQPIIEESIADQLRDTVREEIEEQLSQRSEDYEIDYSELADAIDYSDLAAEISYSDLADELDVTDEVYDAVRSTMDGLQLRNVNITLEV
jgi:uncharacterized phage infection (PIP) family protein YhgE